MSWKKRQAEQEFEETTEAFILVTISLHEKLEQNMQRAWETRRQPKQN